METGGKGFWWGRDLGFKWMQRWVRLCLQKLCYNFPDMWSLALPCVPSLYDSEEESKCYFQKTILIIRDDIVLTVIS